MEIDVFSLWHHVKLKQRKNINLSVFLLCKKNNLSNISLKLKLFVHIYDLCIISKQFLK